MQTIKTIWDTNFNMETQKGKTTKSFVIDNFYNNIVNTNWLGCTRTLLEAPTPSVTNTHG